MGNALFGQKMVNAASEKVENVVNAAPEKVENMAPENEPLGLIDDRAMQHRYYENDLDVSGSRMLEAREFLSYRKQKSAQFRIIDLTKTHKLMVDKIYKPITSAQYPMRTHQFIQIKENLYKCVLTVSGNDRIWGGQFIVEPVDNNDYLKSCVCEMQIHGDGELLDIITSPTLGPHNILQNPFWFKDIYNGLYAYPRDTVNYEILVLTNYAIKSLKYVSQGVVLHSVARQVTNVNSFQLIRCHLNFPLEIKHNVPFKIPAHIAMEEVKFVFLPNHIASISVIIGENYVLYDDIPVEVFALDSGCGFKLDFNIKKSYQPTGYVMSDFTTFRIKFRNLNDLNDYAPVNIGVKFINFYLHDHKMLGKHLRYPYPSLGAL